MDDISEWIVRWFLEHSSGEEKEIRQQLKENYLEKGWIDSFKFILFITQVEKQFGISFSNDEFQNRNFATIAGVAGIIRRKVHGQPEEV
jgi:acyl carrier protein